MRARNAVAITVLLAVATTACSKLTFIRQDAGRKDYKQVAPEYSFRKDAKRTEALIAADRVRLAGQSLGTGNLDEAEKQARLAIKADPKLADGYTVLAVVADQRGQAAEAGKLYAKAVELASGRGDVLNNYGLWLCKNGRGAESLATFDRAIRDPAYQNRSMAWANAGACALDSGQPGRAEGDLRAALQFEPDNATALAAMTKLEFSRGRYLPARGFSERRLAAAPPDVDSLALAAQIEQKLGDTAAAASYSRQLHALGQQQAAQPVTVDNK